MTSRKFINSESNNSSKDSAKIISKDNLSIYTNIKIIILLFYHSKSFKKRINDFNLHFHFKLYF